MSKVFDIKRKLALIFFAFIVVGMWFPVRTHSRSVSCPKIEMVLPSGVIQIEEKATVVLNVPGGFDFTVEWSVSAGLIVEGQGTTAISFMPLEEDSGKTVKVIAKVSALPQGCPSQFEDLIAVEQQQEWHSIDDFGKIPRNDLKDRLDVFLADLHHNDNIGLFVIYFEQKASRKQKLEHVNTILEQIMLRKVDIGRVKFLFFESENMQRTYIYSYSPEARLPKDWRELKLINGNDVRREAKSLFK